MNANVAVTTDGGDGPLEGARPTTERTMTTEGGERARSRGRRARNGERAAAGAAAAGEGKGLGAGARARGGSASPEAAPGAGAGIARGGRRAEKNEAGENREAGAEAGSGRGNPPARSARGERAHLALAAVAGTGEGGAERHPVAGAALVGVVRGTATGAVGGAAAAAMAQSLQGGGGDKIASGNKTHSQRVAI